MKLAEIEDVNPVPWQRYTVNHAAPVETVVANSWEHENGFREVWHVHKEAQLIYGTRGVLRILTPVGIWTLPPFHGIWVPHGISHELHAIGAVIVRTVLVAQQLDVTLGQWQQCQVLHIGPLLDALVNTLADRADDETRSALAVPLLVLELSRAPKLTSGTLPLPQDRRLRAICEQLLSDPQNTDTIELWGERVGASTRTLARLFREETGLSFGQWRQQLRVVEAVAKLALDVPVSTIAAELGYQSSSAFISMFRKTLGETPQRYLKRREGVMAVGC